MLAFLLPLTLSITGIYLFGARVEKIAYLLRQFYSVILFLRNRGFPYRFVPRAVVSQVKYLVVSIDQDEIRTHFAMSSFGALSSPRVHLLK